MIFALVAFVMAALAARDRNALWRAAALAAAAGAAARAAEDGLPWLLAPAAGWIAGALRTRGRLRLERLREIRLRRRRAMPLGEALVPRARIAALPLAARVPEALSNAAARPHAWYPVHDGDLDRICGIVGLVDLAAAEPGSRVKDLVRPALFVPQAQRPAETLALLRERGGGPAIVVDENGRTAGLVCCGDIASALLGETRRTAAAPVALPAEPGTWIVSAAMRRTEFERVFETRLPAGGYETLAGLVLWRLGRMPRVGEQVAAGRALITVQGVTRQAVLAVKVSLPRARRAARAEE